MHHSISEGCWTHVSDGTRNEEVHGKFGKLCGFVVQNPAGGYGASGICSCGIGSLADACLLQLMCSGSIDAAHALTENS